MRRQSCCMNGARQREEDAVDHTKPWLRYVSTSSVSDATLELDDMKVCNETGEDLGTVDGFVVDSESGRPRYVVVDAGGWFTSKQFLVPIGQARLAATRDALRVPLGKDQIESIIDLQMASFMKRVAEKKITLTLSSAAKALLFREGYDPAYGARPMKRAIQRLIQDPLALKILDGEVKAGDSVLVEADSKSGEMKFEHEHAKVGAA